MTCPLCGGKSHTIETRHSDRILRRRRQCKSCGYRFTTQEILIEDVENLKEKADLPNKYPLFFQP